MTRIRTLPVRRALSVSALAATGIVLAFAHAEAQSQERARPVFENGQAQVVPAFADSTRWVREELWVETEFDSDQDGKLDRVHTAVVRPGQTETEGLKVPVIYESSPYFSGTAGGGLEYFWNVRQRVGESPPTRGEAPSVRARTREGIAGSQVEAWVPRGFAVVHSEAPGTGLSEGCPTVGGPPEILEYLLSAGKPGAVCFFGVDGRGLLPFLQGNAFQVEDRYGRHLFLFKNPFHGVFEQVFIFRKHADPGILGENTRKQGALVDQRVPYGSAFMLDKKGGKRKGKDGYQTGECDKNPNAEIFI